MIPAAMRVRAVLMASVVALVALFLVTDPAKITVG
jgi:hypothetical protein